LRGPLRQTEHIGALGVFRATTSFVGWKLAVRVYLAFETLQEGFAGWAGAGTAVTGTRPGDLGCYPFVDVLGQVASPPDDDCG
jgi:hypothetical protein